MRLFEIPEAIEYVLATEVDRETGEITDDTLAKLDELEMKLDEKALAVAAYLKGERAEAAAVKDQADKLAQRARRHANRADRLESYLATHLPEGRELSDATSEIKWRKSTAVDVLDVDCLPESLVTLKTTSSPDKREIAKLLKAGEVVPGARLIERRNMQVK